MGENEPDVGQNEQPSINLLHRRKRPQLTQYPGDKAA